MNNTFNINKTFNGNVIDVEASGLGSHSYPIEVGLVLGNGTTYEALIKPPPDWQHWDKEAEDLHGISRDMLRRLGRSLREVCVELNQLCGGKTLYSDCWVYDSAWITKLFAKAGITPRFKCSPIEGILQEEHLEYWGEHKAEYIRNTQILPHRALNDAIIISETLERLLVNQPPVPTRSMPLAAYA